MLDIVRIQNGSDLGLASSEIPKAANILSVQLGALEYQPDFGIDKRYFLTQGVEIQQTSFRAYCVQRLTESQINISQVLSFLLALFGRNTFYVGTKTIRGFIR
jgi:hypothetical protein